MIDAAAPFGLAGWLVGWFFASTGRGPWTEPLLRWRRSSHWLGVPDCRDAVALGLDRLLDLMGLSFSWYFRLFHIVGAQLARQGQAR